MQNRTLDNRVFNVEQRQRTGPVNAGRARLKEFKELAPTITSSDIVFWLGSRPDPLNDPVGAKLTPAAVAEKPVGWWVELMPADEELKSRIASRVSEIVSKVAFDGNQAAHVNMLCRWQKRLDPDTQLVELHAIDEAYSRTVWWSLAEVWAWRSASGLATHAAFWLMLIVLYPRSTGVQSLFFWNPMIRKIGGLGYVGLLLTLVPPLRRIVLSPFQRALLADAELDAFDADSFFKETPVYDPASGERGDAVEVIPQLRGRLVLEGDSGLGKSMLLRWLAKTSPRLKVFLPATACADGVLQAIADRLDGVAADQPFLASLIYSGAKDIYIDGLNEADPQTVVKVCAFVDKYIHGNIILTTQPMHWKPPATARMLHLRPLPPERVKSFLHSRAGALSEGAAVGGQAFISACNLFFDNRFAGVSGGEQPQNEQPGLQRHIDHVLSNPINLTSLARLISMGVQPDLARLYEQQFQMMEVDFQRNNQQAAFPAARFAETVYAMRLADERELTGDEFRDELECLELHKLMIVRRAMTDSGETRHWRFRHDKVMEFLMLPALLGNPERQGKHIRDSRFRTAYQLLAMRLGESDSARLKEQLIQHAVKTNDISTLTPFIEELNIRQLSPATRVRRRSA